ncbi:MAG: TetR family transcriptional regulator C-terminal domain-containing protein [Pseudoprimorskyibacter sp.]|jgi:TetR/AcrR family transcriptional regulator|nr:TetR family transcriptional regulator C-terminal domain-containing protein [Pseudoprimorskyibacter sp.]
MTQIDDAPRKASRIQRERQEQIFQAALDVFSTHGFRGASINQIAAQAGMSTPSLLYYFNDKQALYRAILRRTIELWLGPLHALNETSGDPVEEICAYIQRKIDMSRNFPRESRLFAAEILMGIPHAQDAVFEPLRDTFHIKISLIDRWVNAGRISQQDPHHLMYSIWATTQHYADFEAQIAGLSPNRLPTLWEDADAFLVPMYRKLLTPT